MQSCLHTSVRLDSHTKIKTKLRNWCHPFQDYPLIALKIDKTS